MSTLKDPYNVSCFISHCRMARRAKGTRTLVYGFVRLITVAPPRRTSFPSLGSDSEKRRECHVRVVHRLVARELESTKAPASRVKVL